jgi:hypothetical protein
MALDGVALMRFAEIPFWNYNAKPKRSLILIEGRNSVCHFKRMLIELAPCGE